MMSIVASDIDTDDLQPKVNIIFYQNSECSYAEYAWINDLKAGAYQPLSHKAAEVLIQTLKSSGEKGRRDYYMPGIIPENVLNYNTDFLSPKIIWLCKSKTTNFHFLDKTYTLNYPNLLFHFELNELRIYAVKTPYVNDKTKLYKCPFPNIYNGGALCFGTMSIDKFISKNLLELMKNMEDVFFNSKFTNEMMGDNVTKTKTLTLLKSLTKNQQAFPNDELIYLKDAKDVLRK